MSELSWSSGTTLTVPAGTATDNLQRLIGTAPAGATIRLEAGDYILTRPLEIDRGDISLLGVGATRFVVDFDGGREGNAIELHGGNAYGSVRLVADAGEGATVLRLESTHDFSAGDYLWIETENTDSFLDSIGDENWRKDKPLRTTMVRVESVDGDRVVLENGVYFDHDASITTVERIEPLRNVEIGGFEIRYGFGTPDPDDFSNTLSSDYHRTAAMSFFSIADVTVRDVHVQDGASNAFNFERAVNVSADALSTDGAHDKGSGGNGYAYQLKSVFESEFTGLEDQHMRHSLVFGSWYSSAYNQIEILSTDRDVNFHGGRDHHNTVHVVESIRGADVISTVLWQMDIPGESYGAPTDMTTNIVTFDHVVGSKRDDFVHGDDNANFLDGAAGDDALYGEGGDDVLAGGTGNDDDLLVGGAGVDTALFAGPRADYDIQLGDDPGEVIVDGPHGTDTLRGVEWIAFEDGSLELATAIAGYVPDAVGPPSGDAEPPSGDGAGTPDPDAGGGSDPGDGASVVTLQGSDGRDTYRIDDPLVRIAEAPDGDWDTVEASVDYTLDENVEKLQLIGDAVEGTGNELRNVILGNDGANVLRGEGGDDSLYGRAGADRLYGGAGDDALDGGEGDDVLMGGGGRDELEGGAGADEFEFADARHSVGAARDRIVDFDAGEGDTIDLTRIDANAGTSGRQAFVYVGATAFSGAAGELRFADGLLVGDVDGDGAADFEVEMEGVAALGNDDLLL
jgi:hypothetical protein